MSFNYNGTSAVQYAMDHAKNPNTVDYPYYPATGGGSGDCANFVSQCLRAGGLYDRTQGFLWYCINKQNPSSWSGVDSLRKFLMRPFGRYHLTTSHYSTKDNMKKGDLIFTVVTGTSNPQLRDTSHVTIVSRDYVVGSGKIYVCGHTADQLDEVRNVTDDKSHYMHIDAWIIEDYTLSSYQSSTDRSTAQVDLGGDRTYSTADSSTVYTAVKNIQTRLNFLGFNAGTVDGKYGSNTGKAVTAFQTACRIMRNASMTIGIDGKVGPETKEALMYPKHLILP